MPLTLLPTVPSFFHYKQHIAIVLQPSIIILKLSEHLPDVILLIIELKPDMPPPKNHQTELCEELQATTRVAFR